jgi:zinc transporter
MTSSQTRSAEPEEEDGLLFGCKLDGKGGASLIGWKDLDGQSPEGATIWLHLDSTSERVKTWLHEKSGLTETTAEALLAEETRPRVFRGKRGMVAILRGVNTNPGSQPKDMVALRIWSDGSKVITLRQHRLMTPRDVLAQLTQEGNGPKNASQLYLRLISRLIERMAPTVAGFDENLDNLEASLDISRANETRRKLSDLRQDSVILRRYVFPQREALNNLMSDPPVWMDDRCRLHLRETIDRLLRYIEELDAARERAMVIRDDISNQLAESTNKTLYVLSIISAVFLPLGFLTGLLGINIGGMPGIDNPYAFWIACLVMISIIIAELIIFRRLRWL